jgi:hypothetical protein
MFIRGLNKIHNPARVPVVKCQSKCNFFTSVEMKIRGDIDKRILQIQKAERIVINRFSTT